MIVKCRRCSNSFSNASGPCCGNCGHNSRPISLRLWYRVRTEWMLLKGAMGIKS